MIRTRFAPSPTGALHLGNVRVAVFNWLFARRHEGQFILRVEDTDVERHRGEAEASIAADLKWLGLNWDEGPDTGGPCGPYRQSEAQELHREAVDRLQRKGAAYPCFCNEEELAQDRIVDESGGEVHRYPGRCRDLPAERRAELRAERGSPAVRFRTPDDPVEILDEVRGPIHFNTDDIGDFILLRRDGRPTYNLAVVVDDIRMHISHVIRGAGHLSNTPKQVLLFQALGAPVPSFIHLPTVLAPEGGKLSKRSGASAVGELRAEGYHPHAVVNYVSLLGWSPPDDEEEVFAPEELARLVDVSRIGASDTTYDPDKLRWMSAQHIARMELDEVVGAVSDRVDRARFPLEGDTLRFAVDALRSRLSTFGEINEHLELLFPTPGAEWDAAREELRQDPKAREVLREVRDRLRDVEQWTPDELGRTVRAVGKELGARGPSLFHPVRLALTSQRSGPDLGKVLAALGPEEAIVRMNRALESSKL